MAELFLAPDLGAPLGLRFAVGRHGRKPTVGRIDDQRRPLGSDDLVAAVVPELVVGDDAARHG